MRQKKAALRPTPHPSATEPAQAHLEAMQASCLALCPNGYSAERFHADGGAGIAEDAHALSNAPRPTADAESRDPFFFMPAGVGSLRTDDPARALATLKEIRATTGRRVELKERRLLMVISPRMNRSIRTLARLHKWKLRRSSIDRISALARGRRLGADANEKKAKQLREQIRAIWQSLPEHLRRGSQVLRRLNPLRLGDPVCVRTVNRHLLALGLSKS